MLRTALALVAAAALASLSLLPAQASVARRADLSFSSRALGGTLHYEVYLPAGYGTSAQRYPVVYFLHGLPAAPTSYRSFRYIEQALASEGRPAILVIPQAARRGESDPEYLDKGPGDDWNKALAKELPRMIDARFRTIPDRKGRAIIGLSAGGYGAMHLALRHLDEFGVVESWSGYFHPTNPAGTRPLELGSAAKDARANVHRQLAAERKQLHSEPLFIAFYVGRSDRRFERENIQLDRELQRAHVAHVFRLYPGGHTQRLWQAHAAGWLGLALAHLAPAR
jgi:enterochelin esterase-like enzyme